MEAAADLAAGLVLRNLKDADEAFLLNVSEPDGRTVGENRKNNGVEYFTPVGKIEAANRVAQDPQGDQGRSHSGGHDGNMLAPVKCWSEEDP
jgi:hypothetical protein